MRFYRNLILAALLLVAGGVRNAGAASFPETEVRILIGFPAGSSIELSLRALAKAAEKYVGQPLIIVNKPGASQSIALGELARSKNDGYTIAATTDGFLFGTRHQQKLNFDPTEFRILLGYAQLHHVLFVKGDSPYKTIEDFINAARAGQSKLNYGGTGQATTPFLLGHLFFKEAKSPITYVPFKGTNELVPAILGGHVISGVNATSILMSHFRSGELRPLLAFNTQRFGELPDIPSSSEKGFSDSLGLFNTTLIIVAPKGTPNDRADHLAAAFKKAVDDPEFKKLADEMGLQAVYSTPEVVRERVSHAEKIIVPILKDLNLYVN